MAASLQHSEPSPSPPWGRGSGRGLTVLLLIAACSAPTPVPDAGLDAGPICSGLTTEHLCVALSDFSTICGTSRAATIAREFRTCDAGLGTVGYLGVGACGDVETVEWTYGFPGDTYRCFFASDGGALVGAINFSDHGVLTAGTVGACTAMAPAQCRDGG